MSLSIQITNGIISLKEGDTLTSVEMKLVKGNGVAYDLTGKTATVIIANKYGKILEKPAMILPTTGDISFKVDIGEITGHGQMRLEVHVLDGEDTTIFPSSDYLILNIDANLNIIGQTITSYTFDKLKNDLGFEISSVQKQINQLVVEGDSSPEAAQARVGADGEVYETLKERLDAEYPIPTERLSNESIPSSKLRIGSDADRIKLVNLSDEVLQAMAGSTPVNSTPSFNSVTTEKISPSAVTPDRTSFLASGKNKLNLANAETDSLLQSNGQTTSSVGYKTSEYIYLPAGTYTLSRVRWYGFYDLTKTIVTNPFVNTGSNSAIVSVTIDQARYLRVSFSTSNQNSVQVESGSTATAYEAYKLTAPLMKLTPEQIQQVPVPNLSALYPLMVTKNGENFTMESQFDSTQNIVIQTSRNGSKNGAFNFLSTTVGGVVIHPNTDDITPIRTFTTVGANHGYTTVVIATMASNGKTTADLGSRWTDGVTQYVLLNVDGDKLTFGCPYTVTNDIVSSTYVAPVANLTHVSGATNTSPINVSTLDSEPQLFPSINNISVKYVLDGKEITADGVYYGNELQIQEQYTVMDYKAIIDYAQANIGSSYKNANIEGVVKLSNVFVYRKGLKCTTAHGFETLKKVSLLNCGFLQSIPLSPAGHTRKRFLPGVNAKSGWDFEAGIDLDAYNVSLIFGSSDLKVAGVAPSHYTDWTYQGGTRRFGFTMGYIVDKGNANHAERIANTTTIWDMRNTKKSYPVALRGTLEAGQYRSYFGFRNYMSPEEVGAATNLNIVTDHRNSYVYITLNNALSSLSKRVDNRIGWGASLLQTSGVTLKNNVVDANGVTFGSNDAISDAIVKLS